MNKFSFRIFASLLVLSFFLVAAHPTSPIVRVAVIDSPVDFMHPDLRTAVNTGLLKELTVEDISGKTSWYDLNEKARYEFTKQLKIGTYKNAVDFIDAKTLNDSGDRSFAVLYRMTMGQLRYTYSEEFRKHVDAAGTYLHGTHVAGIMINSISDVELITFPLIPPAFAKKMSLLEIIELTSRPTENLKNYLGINLPSLTEQISKSLKENQVRVVNMSFSNNPEQSIKSIQSSLDAEALAYLKTDPLLREKIIRFVLADVSQAVQQWHKVINDNPNTIFVISAGNDGQKISDTTNGLVNIRAPNVLKVAALNSNESLAPFSNKSSKYVDIAAHGVAILSALSDGTKIHMSGTSMSAPEVSNYLTKIFVNNPELSAAEGMKELFTKHSVIDPNLDVVVANGRRLQINSDSENLNFDITKVKDLSKFQKAVVANLKALTGKTLSINIQDKGPPVYQTLSPRRPLVFQCKDIF